MRQLLSRLAAEVELREALTIGGLACLAGSAAAVWSLAGALAVIGAGCFYLGVFHRGAR